MTDHTVVVYRNGTFTSEPEPLWRHAAREFAAPSEFAWVDTVSAELGCDCGEIGVRQDSIREANVVHWTLPGGGHYIEFHHRYFVIEAVLIPNALDWLRFYIDFVAPFLQAHATVCISHRQQRIANVLTATARHGEGLHVDEFIGTSERDTQRRPVVVTD